MITNFNVAVEMANKVVDQRLMENVKMIEEATENRALALCYFYLKYGNVHCFLRVWEPYLFHIF